MEISTANAAQYSSTLLIATKCSSMHLSVRSADRTLKNQGVVNINCHIGRFQLGTSKGTFTASLRQCEGSLGNFEGKSRGCKVEGELMV